MTRPKDVISKALTESHLPGDLNNLVQRYALGVFDVLLLLAIPWRFLEGLDDERRCGWDNTDGGLTILDGELHGNAETLPVTSSLGNVFSDLLWR